MTTKTAPEIISTIWITSLNDLLSGAKVPLFFLPISLGYSPVTIKFLSILAEKGVEFVSLKENIDITTPQGRFMLTVFGALAELERENILERTEKMIFHQTFHDWTKKEEKDFSLSSQLVKKASQSLAA